MTQRRKTDQQTASQRDAHLTTEEKQDRYLRNLSASVSIACDRWLAGRGIKAPQFLGSYGGPSPTTPPQPSCGPESPCQPASPDSPGAPRDGVESLAG